MYLRLRISPKHLAHQARGPRLGEAVDGANIIQSDIIPGEETSMDHENLAIQDMGQGKGIEALGEEGKDSLVELGLGLTLETIDTVHLPSLMITAGQEEVMGEAAFVSKEQEDDLDGEGTAVDKVTIKEESMGFRGLTGEVKEIEEIVELTMNITAHGDLPALWDGHIDERGLLCHILLDASKDLEGVLAMKGFLLLEVRDKLIEELICDLQFPGGVGGFGDTRTFVGIIHGDGLNVQVL